MHGRELAATDRLACVAAAPEDPTVDQIRSWAQSRNLTVVVDPVGTRPEIVDPVGTVGIAVGGDGTFLEAVRAFAERGVPVLGVDRGTLSFLARVPADRVEAALDELLTGTASIQTHQRLSITGTGIDTVGVNDVTLEPDMARDTYRHCRIEAFLNEEYLGCYSGEGLVVATPTGSTAMALSADGPVQMPGGDCLHIVPLHPDTISTRTVVFDAGRSLVLVPRSSITVSVDGGRTTATVPPGEQLEMTGAKRPAHIVRTSYERSFMTALVAKLRWGLRDETTDRTGVGSPRTPSLETDNQYGRAVEVAREATVAAGDLVVRYLAEHGHGQDTADEAESRSEQILVTAIEQAFPDDAVLTDEGLRPGRVWLFDALDGRINAEHGNPNYCVSLALLVDRKPTVGVVYVPASSECFHAVRGGRAFRNETPVEPTDRDELAEGMLLSGYDPDGMFLRTCYRHSRGVRRLGSQALNLCSVAAGTADACWEYDTRPHDIAAALCILRAAGGRASTPTGEPFGVDSEHRTPLLASNGRLHPALLELLEETGRV